MVLFSRIIFQSSIFSLALMSAASAFAMDSNERLSAPTLASATSTQVAMNHAAASSDKDQMASNSSDGYVPATKYDNSQYRFNMNQNGKKMTAEEFDAWMKSRGIHVVKAHPATGSSTAPTTGN